MDKETLIKLLKDKDIREHICSLVMAELPRRLYLKRPNLQSQTVQVDQEISS